VEYEERSVSDLAHCQVIAVAESIVPPRIFRPASAHCSKHKPGPMKRAELLELVNSFPDDRSLRDWIQTAASPHQVYTLWQAIAELQRHFFLYNESGQDADPAIVEEVRAHPSARGIFSTAVRLWRREGVIED
jgi:hypothetical protein